MIQFRATFLRLGAAACLASIGNAAIVINEFQYDDTVGTADDREFVEIYNSGNDPVDIGGWILGGADPAGPNTATVIPTGTMLGAGSFWVIGQTGVPNVNQVVTSIFENDNETLELYDTSSNLVDAVLYEGNKGTGFVVPTSQLDLQIGNTWGYFGNHQGVDTTNFRTLTTVARHVDGRDTNNNGRDFGLRPSTPGASNHAAGIMTSYSAPNVDQSADGTLVGSLTGSFVGARVITPGVASPGLNPNAIPAAPGTTKAIIAYDNAGGGNAVVSNQVYTNGGSFMVQVYLDTNDLPVSTNSTGGTIGRGVEETFFGIGSIDALMNFADLSGFAGLPPSDIGPNGASGVHWYYEKVGESFTGAGDVSEKLYLVDAGDSGPANVDGVLGFDWTILATIDLSTTNSGWFTLGIFIAPDGTGAAIFGEQVFQFTTTAGLTGEFSVGYRENTTDLGVGVPAYLRPPTFAVPEPAIASLFGLGAVALTVRRRARVSSLTA